MHKAKTNELHNELKPTENQQKMNVCLLTLYLNHFNNGKLMFGRTLEKQEKFFDFYWIQQILDLWHCL